MKKEQYRAFKEMLTEEMQAQDVVFEERQVLKVNRKLHGIIVRDAEDTEDAEDAEDSCVKSVFYAEDCFKEYQNGKSVCEIVQNMRKKIAESEEMRKIVSKPQELFRDEKWKACLIAQVINTKRNEEFLAKIPRRNLLDLSIIYRIELSNGMSAVVNHDMLRLFGETEEDLFKIAKKNILEKYPFSLFPVSIGLWGIVNTKFSYGASAILLESKLCEMASHADGNIYIIPSSINELLFIKADGGEEEALLSIIKYVNQTALEKEDILSDNLYHYDKDTKKLTLIEQK